jgi:hypothetical protein
LAQQTLQTRHDQFAALEVFAIDCLQLTAKRIEGEEIEQVIFEEFDLAALFSA